VPSRPCGRGSASLSWASATQETPEDRDKAEEAVREIFAESLRLGGTMSGEHGIGLTKAPYLGMELADAAMATMKKVKQLFDPNGILNPGKIFPA
jgi:glycolate oxidase